MLGIDITFIPRFEKVTSSFIKKILHPKEVLEYEKSKTKSKFLAARWAIKEALYKSDNTFNKYNEIFIKKNDKYIFPSFNISTSREGDYYIAIVQKEKDENKN